MADLDALALKLLSTGPHKIETTPRRVRALFDGIWLFDTTSARFVWEEPAHPQFWVPATAFGAEVLTRGRAIDAGAFGGTVKGRERATDRVLIFEKGPLAGLVRVEFGAVDAWFEEDAPIYDHPKSPARMDILPSSREIEVKIAGVTVAKSSNEQLLLERGLRPRYYLPKTSVQWQYLTPSKTTSVCPHKGKAQYYDVTIEGKKYADHVWWYEHATAESAPVEGLVCFYNEKVDTYIDGILEKK